MSFDRTALQEAVADSVSIELDVRTRSFQRPIAEKRILGHLEQKLAGHRMDKWWQRMSLALVYVNGFNTIHSLSVLISHYGPACYGYVVFFTFVVGFPVYYLEYSLGQFTSVDHFSVMSRISPIMSGVGITASWLNFAQLVQTTRFLATSLPVAFYVLMTLASKRGYALDRCVYSFNDQLSCFDHSLDCRRFTPTITNFDGEEPFDLYEEYKEFNSQCLRARSQLDNNEVINKRRKNTLFHESGTQQYLGRQLRKNRNLSITFDLWLALFSAWFLTVLISLLGLRATVLMSVASVFLTVAGVLVSLIVHVFFKRLRFYSIIGNYDGASELKDVLTDSLIHVISTLNLGKGGITVLGSFNKFHNNALRDCAIVLLVYITFPMLCALIYDQAIRNYVFGFLDINGPKLPPHVPNIVLASIMTVYEEYSPSIALIYGFCTSLYYLTHQMFVTYVMVFALKESLVIIEKDIISLLSRTIAFSIALGTAMFTCSFAAVMYDAFRGALRRVPPFLVLLELFTVVVIYGPRKMFVDINYMLFGQLGEKEARRSILKKYVGLLNLLLSGMWVIVTPALLVFLVGADKFWLPMASELHSTNVTMLFMLPVFAYGAYKIIRSKLFEGTTLSVYVQPDLLWGPREDRHRKEMEREHMKARLRR